jgi:hypothetical protein
VIASALVLCAIGYAPALAETREFENATSLSLPQAMPCCSAVVASHYPSTINVSGVYGAIGEVRVTLHRLSHEDIEELAVLLVGPNGSGVVLMASYEPGRHLAWPNESDWIFEDFAQPVRCPEPEGTFRTSDKVRPFNCGLLAPFPTPAPAEPYGSQLDSLGNYGDPNGAWSLYVDDAFGAHRGSIIGGWSLRIETMTWGPFNLIPPSISGIGQPGQTLSCEPGSWVSNPSPSFAYQWLRDGSGIAGATSSTYVVQGADEGHTLSCEVKASNAVGGHGSAVSAGVAIPAKPAPGGSSSGGSSTSGSSTSPIAVISSAKLALALADQLAPSPKASKIRDILKHGGLTLPFRALEAGRTEISWYQAPLGASFAKKTKAKPLLVASGRLTFAAASTGAISLKLTTAGKRLLRHVTRLRVTAKGTFTPTGATPITAMSAFVLKK